jgi:hypothetical protein
MQLENADGKFFDVRPTLHVQRQAVELAVWQFVFVQTELTHKDQLASVLQLKQDALGNTRHVLAVTVVLNNADHL